MPSPRLGPSALLLLLLPVAAALVLLRRAVGLDELPLELDPFEIDLQLRQRSDAPEPWSDVLAPA